MAPLGPATAPSRSWCRSPAPRARRAWREGRRSSRRSAGSRRGSPARSGPAGDRTVRDCRRRTARTCTARSRHLGTPQLSSGARRRRVRSTEAFPCSPPGSARATGPSGCCVRSRPRGGRTISRPRSTGTRPVERWWARCRCSTPAPGTWMHRSGPGGPGSARSSEHAPTPRTRRSCRTGDVRRTGTRCPTGRSRSCRVCDRPGCRGCGRYRHPASAPRATSSRTGRRRRGSHCW